jgi:hypothetical protein
MRLPFAIIILLLLACSGDKNINNNKAMSIDDQTKFEKSNGLETVTYEEGIHYFKHLAKAYPEIEMRDMGPTDSGLPLNVVLYSKDGDFDIKSLRKKNKTVVLINNAIHPGEPDGVDASMMLLRDIVQGKILVKEMEDIVLAIIPFYNIGGALNRGPASWVNQNGPQEYGFRGNARNYDLNRDFIKCDTKNAQSFAEIFHMLDPDIFLDTHVSNGADYQYVITLISTQKDKLGGPLAEFQEQKLLPFLYNYMEKNDFEMTPYVNTWGQHLNHPTPDLGIEQFPDHPRYSTGYSTLFNTIGFMTETHMLKDYRSRVLSTYTFMEAMLEATYNFKDEILDIRHQAKTAVKTQVKFDIAWEIDTSQHRMITFKGYESSTIKSEVTGQDRLIYNQKKPYEKTIPYYDNYKPTIGVRRPTYYVIPQSWHNVLDLLRLNGVKMEVLDSSQTLQVEYYTIKDYDTVNSAYEGHYLHYNTQVDNHKGLVHFRKGDIKIPVNQDQNRYIIETLEPQAVDSYFNWNFFDMILQRKEHFSPYVFEDLAVKLLQDNPDLKSSFEKKKIEDPDFASNANAQLNYIYAHSDHAEPEFMRYPVYRVY